MPTGIQFTDYSALYYDTVLGEPVPPRRGGKFVVVEDREGATHLVLSPAGLSRLHAHIVERFAIARGIPGRYTHRGERYRFNDRRWRVAGGGYWERDEAGAQLRLYGRSQAYGAADLRRVAAMHNVDGADGTGDLTLPMES